MNWYNPPTSGDWTSDIQLSFPSLQGNGAHKLIDMRGPLTVTSGAAIIADDPTNPVGPGGGSVSGAFWTIDGGSTQYNCEGTQSYPVLPWLPTGSNVESATYKVDHD